MDHKDRDVRRAAAQENPQITQMNADILSGPDRVDNELLGGRSRGMTSMEQSLAELVRANAVTADEARVRSFRPEEPERMLAGS